MFAPDSSGMGLPPSHTDSSPGAASIVLAQLAVEGPRDLQGFCPELPVGRGPSSEGPPRSHRGAPVFLFPTQCFVRKRVDRALPIHPGPRPEGSGGALRNSRLTD